MSKLEDRMSAASAEMFVTLKELGAWLKKGGTDQERKDWIDEIDSLVNRIDPPSPETWGCSGCARQCRLTAARSAGKLPEKCPMGAVVRPYWELVYPVPPAGPQPRADQPKADRTKDFRDQWWRLGSDRCLLFYGNGDVPVRHHIGNSTPVVTATLQGAELVCRTKSGSVYRLDPGLLCGNAVATALTQETLKALGAKLPCADWDA